MSNENHLLEAFEMARSRLPSATSTVTISEKQAKKAIRKYIARTDPALADLPLRARRIQSPKDRAAFMRDLRILVLVPDKWEA